MARTRQNGNQANGNAQPVVELSPATEHPTAQPAAASPTPAVSETDKLRQEAAMWRQRYEQAHRTALAYADELRKLAAKVHILNEDLGAPAQNAVQYLVQAQQAERRVSN